MKESERIEKKIEHISVGMCPNLIGSDSEESYDAGKIENSILDEKVLEKAGY